MHGNKGKKQSQEHKNKINTPERAEKIRKTLLRLYAEGKKVCWIKGKKHSEETKEKMKLSTKKGNQNHSWKGNKASYYAFHDWIRTYFGKAIMCENRENNILDFECSKKSNHFQWARKKGHRYSRNKNDYFQLCISCHSKYDYNHKNRICDVEGCGQKHKFYGYCLKHGQRFKKWGNPFAVKTHHNPIKFIK